VTATRLAFATLLVPDYDAGIAFCVGALGFDLIEDSDMGGGKRWVVVGSKDGGRLLLAKPATAAQSAAIGKQTGGRVTFFPAYRRFRRGPCTARRSRGEFL
jgi:catechol 2,3-dioxygenase-like lactoylglutathione lyase family enzyme